MKFNHLAAAAAAMSLVAGQALAAEIKIPEGTEFSMRLEDTISSKTANTGDRFTVSLDDNVKLPDGTVLKAGYRGVGEIIEARKNGMLGKTGKLNVRLLYLKVGDERIRLRANKGVQGEHRTGAQVVTFVLIWPVAGFIKGKNIEINKGTMLTAFSDNDTVLAGPLTPPPAEM